MSVELGEQLRELRLLRTYYTQAQVAELLSIDRSSYTRYEMGTTEPPISTLLKLCEIYGISCFVLDTKKDCNYLRFMVRFICET